jgi:hypothetical protein
MTVVIVSLAIMIVLMVIGLMYWAAKAKERLACR